jgi:TRAP-type transport system periplasmic protein
MRKALLVLLVLAVAGVMPAFTAGRSEAATGVIELTAATINPENSHLARSMKAMLDAIERESGGRISISFYPGGQLGDASSLYESVVNGNIDIVMSDTGWFAQDHPEFDVLESSYLFRDKQQYLRILNSEERLGYFEQLILDRPGLRTLMYVGGMERNIISTFPINSIDDLSGRTMRSRPVTTELEWWQLLGSRPEAVAFQETYSAMQTRVVEGSQNSIDAMINMRFMEVAKYIARTQHAIHLGMVVMNESRFQGLPSDMQSLILRVSREVQPEYLERAFVESDEQLRTLQQQHGVTVTNPDTGPFIEASRRQMLEIAAELNVEQQMREIFY